MFLKSFLSWAKSLSKIVYEMSGFCDFLDFSDFSWFFVILLIFFVISRDFSRRYTRFLQVNYLSFPISAIIVQKCWKSVKKWNLFLRFQRISVDVYYGLYRSMVLSVYDVDLYLVEGLFTVRVLWSRTQFWLVMKMRSKNGPTRTAK